MKRERCNPFIDAPLTMKRIVLMAVSTIVFVASAIYGTIRGVLGFCSKNKRERRDDFHVMMNKIFRWELRIHPWLHCDINNPYSEHFERGAIAICNHQSLLDTLCLLILSPKLLIVTGKRVWNNPIVKPVLFFADFICVNRSVDDMLEYCRSHIAEGYTIVFSQKDNDLLMVAFYDSIQVLFILQKNYKLTFFHCIYMEQGMFCLYIKHFRINLKCILK